MIYLLLFLGSDAYHNLFWSLLLYTFDTQIYHLKLWFQIGPCLNFQGLISKSCYFFTRLRLWKSVGGNVQLRQNRHLKSPFRFFSNCEKLMVPNRERCLQTFGGLGHFLNFLRNGLNILILFPLFARLLSIHHVVQIIYLVLIFQDLLDLVLYSLLKLNTLSFQAFVSFLLSIKLYDKFLYLSAVAQNQLFPLGNMLFDLLFIFNFQLSYDFI